MIGRRMLLMGLVILAVGTIAYLVYQSLNYGTLLVQIDSNTPVTGTKVTVGKETVYPSGAEAKTYRIKVKAGHHLVHVTSPDTKEYTSNASVGFRSEKTLHVTLESKSVDEVAADLYQPDQNTKLSGAKYYGDKAWLVFYASSLAGGEGSIVVAKYNPAIYSWRIVDEGTDIDTSTEDYRDAPPGLMNLLGSY